jgi:hypothetical protein
MASSDSYAHANTHTADTHPDINADAHHDSRSSGKKHSLASVVKSPAVKKHDKVLAETAEQVAAEGIHPRLSSELNAHDLTDHEKAKLLVEERDANAPTGNFVLGNHKPAMVSQGYGEYYGAKAATQNRT